MTVLDLGCGRNGGGRRKEAVVIGVDTDLATLLISA